MEYASSSWKEWGVLGGEAIRTETSTLTDYKVGINTVARSGGSINSDSWKTGFVNTSTIPQANLDVDGNATIGSNTAGSLVVGAGGDQGGFCTNWQGGTEMYALAVDRSGTGNAYVDIWDRNSAGVVIGATSSEKTLTVDAGGNVGIGTTAPTSKLALGTTGVNSGGLSIKSTAADAYGIV